MGNINQASSTLIPAEMNIYYCLATLHGTNPNNLASNRRDWNTWMGATLPASKQARAQGILNNRLRLASDPKRIEAVRQKLAARTGDPSIQLPDARSIDMSNLDIATSLLLEGFIFLAPLRFDGSRLVQNLNLTKAYILEGISLEGTVCEASALFSGLHAYNRANFDGAHFKDDAVFSAAQFNGELSASRVHFSGSALLSELKCQDRANFSHCRFAKAADFEGATFSSRVIFDYARFAENGNFINVEFEGATEFNHAKFATLVPDFRGAEMHEATEFMGVSWPPNPKESSVARKNLYAYERLKQEMEKLKKHEDEQGFFCQELRAKRVLSGYGSPGRHVSYLYDLLSLYGQSLQRPILWLVGCILAGMLIYSNFATIGGKPVDPVWAVRYSFANTFSFLPLRRDLMSPYAGEMSSLFFVTSVVQAGLGLVLAFLVGLALRNRFRMR